MHEVYGARGMALLSEAFGVLLASAEERRQRRDWEDALGDIYMQWGWPNEGTGQFFTPMPICRAMAQMMMADIDIETACRQRVADAIDRGVWGRMGLLNGKSLTEPGKEATMLAALAMNYQHLEPLRISDPCVGSGAMLLAAASLTPQWALDYQVVQFYGMDIDPICVTMCRINMMLYGLNGYFLRLNGQLARGLAERKLDIRATVVQQDAATEPELGVLVELPGQLPGAASALVLDSRLAQLELFTG